MTQPDWDDERLALAFHDRFDRSAPPTLGFAIHGAIAGTTPARYHALGRVPARNLAAAAVVVLLVGSVALALAGVGRLGGGPSLPSDGTAIATLGDSATPTADATDKAPLGSVLGLPIIDVPSAIAIRDAGADDRELAVQGWFTPGNPAVRCAAPRVPQTSPIQGDCGDGSMWLTQDPESLVHRTSSQTTNTEPQGSAIRPYLDNVDLSWQPADRGIDPNGDSKPTDVVFIGHFDDRRAALCPVAALAACRDRFVVDSVAQVRGVPQVRSERHTEAASSTVVDIEAIIANEAPASPILSIVVTQYPEDLAFAEPSLVDGDQGLINEPVLWIVRVLESERVVTYIVVDGSDRIYEITADGEAIQVGGSSVDPVATPGPWPPDGAAVLELTSEVGAGMPPVQVAVVDLSGRLLHVAEMGSVDPASANVDDPGAYTEPGKPGRLHLAWTGSICDGRITLTVAADVRSMILENGRRPTCHAIAIGRELVLDFSGSVVIPAVLEATANMTTPAGRDYELICGSLDQATCEDRAIRIVDTDFDQPGKRVVSITFSGEGPCGWSSMVLFNDGTASGSDPSCFIPPSVAPSPGYQLDCGPLDPEACETRAAEIVAANLKRDPPKRVVSLTITSLCGSYSAIFDDGTGSSAILECIPG